MKYQAIIYLHGFNSASQDLNGQLLVQKQKLAVLQAYCEQQQIRLIAPNVSYRHFEDLIEDQLLTWNQLLDQGVEAVFMGSSMGGFASEYLGMRTGSPAIMINPVIYPTELLPQFIGVNTNNETGESYDWQMSDCLLYRDFENELRSSKRGFSRLVLLDQADELLDAMHALDFFQSQADVVCFSGGSHAFEHMQEALTYIERVLEE